MRLCLLTVALISLLLFQGCAAVAESSSGNPSAPKMQGGQLLEVVTLISADGSRNLAVLSHRDIAAADGGDPSSVQLKGWSNIFLSRDKVIDSLRRTRFGTTEQPGKSDYAELFLSGCMVHKQYALGDLDLNDSRALLEKFFEKRADVNGDWWIRKSAARSQPIEENGLIALVKELGFEAMRTDIAPVLFVKPPAQLQ